MATFPLKVVLRVPLGLLIWPLILTKSKPLISPVPEFQYYQSPEVFEVC